MKTIHNKMKYLLSIIAAMLVFCSSAEAQRLRLGDRTPDISIGATLGTPIDNILQKYICMVFIHSESAPAVDAADRLCDELISAYDDMAIVLLTAEEKTEDNALLNSFVSHNTSVAFDNNHHTFRSFGINYVPFGVIFDKKKQRIEWFGSLQHLDRRAITNILK